MKFDAPATTNPIDQLKIIGKSTDRIDGPHKTSGLATYAYEHHDVAANVAYGFVIGAAIAKGRIAAMDTTRAQAAPGVLAIVTAANAGKLGKGDFNTAKLLGGPQIDHYHQAVAVIVAETFEQARAAASLVKIDYVHAKGSFDLAEAKDTATKPKDSTDTIVGDFAAAFAAAPVQLDETYATPDHSHAMMEPHASIAIWNGDKLTLWTSNQMIAWGAGDVAKTLGIPKANVRLVSPFIGGGFGGKLFVRSDAILAALGARAARRPVKLALTRPLIFNNTTHRPATIQRIRLGATKDGKLTAIGHENWSGDLAGGGPEDAVQQTRLLYAGANRLLTTRLAVLDLPEGNAMRAPGEAPGLMALEVAMDELAEKLAIDPIELRILNDTQVDPEKPERAFSQRQLIQCLRTGADTFGWARRRAPGQARDGRWMVGMGVAAAFRNNLSMKSAARVRLEKDGVVTVETDMTDIGTGSYTIIAQTAAEMMGVSLDQVAVKLGDSSFPVSAGSGGQWGANSSTAGVYAACVKLREAVAQKLGFDPGDGGIRRRPGPCWRTQYSPRPGRRRRGPDGRGHHGIWRSGQDPPAIDLRRALRRGWSRCGHRRDPRPAHAGRLRGRTDSQSQVRPQPGDRRHDHGGRRGADGGTGDRQAPGLLRQPRPGRLRGSGPCRHPAPGGDLPGGNRSDVLADEGQGRGELGICGVAAAVANAVHNATGVRVRHYPVTLDKLLNRLPEIA